MAVVGNKIRSAKDEEFLKRNLPDLPILGFIPFDDQIIEADLGGRPPYEAIPELLEVARAIARSLRDVIKFWGKRGKGEKAKREKGKTGKTGKTGNLP